MRLPCAVNKIKLLCVLASQDGLKHVQTQFPGVEVSGHGIHGLAHIDMDQDMGFGG